MEFAVLACVWSLMEMQCCFATSKRRPQALKTIPAYLAEIDG